MLTPADVRAARERIDRFVRRTPLVASPHPGLWLKLENEQRSGAFKARGAFAALTARRLAPAGVVTHSSGNHGRALAEAAAELGIPATVVVPDTAAAHKVAAIERAGATVLTVAPAERRSVADALARDGRTLVPPFDDEDVMAGQGTTGLEICEQAPHPVSRVWVPVGGAGLLSGVAVALSGTGTTVTGVEPALAADYADSVARGRRVSWPVEATSRTVADGLRLPSVGERPWRHLRALRIGVVTVSEDQIHAALDWLDGIGIAAEPSGAVSVAGALACGPVSSGMEVAIVSGGNRA